MYMENQYNLVPKVIKMDNEFYTNSLQNWLRQKGLQGNVTNLSSSHENPHAETNNRKNAGITRAILDGSGLDESFWPFAQMKSTEKWNTTPKSYLNNTTPSQYLGIPYNEWNTKHAMGAKIIAFTNKSAKLKIWKIDRF